MDEWRGKVINPMLTRSFCPFLQQFEGLTPEEDFEVSLETHLRHHNSRIAPITLTTALTAPLFPVSLLQIPGNYRDAMTSNTPLGKAVKEACAELDTLAALERETLSEADALLKKLGLKTSIFDVPAGSGGEGESSSEGQ